MRTSHRDRRQKAAAHLPRKINLSVFVSLCVTLHPLIFLFLLLARSLVVLSDLLWVLLHGDRVGLPFWHGGHHPLPLGSLIYTTSGRIYWPRNTMRTCPCPSTETRSRPLFVYLFAVAIHIRPLRHVTARGRRRKRWRRRRKKQRKREYGIGLSEYFAPGRVKVARECYSCEESRETDDDCLKDAS